MRGNNLAIIEMFTSKNRADYLKMAGLVATYVVLAQLVAKVLGSNSVIGFMLFASGIALAVLVLAGVRFLPAMFLGALLGFVSVGEPFSLALVSSLRHVGTLFVCAWLLRRTTQLNPDLESLRDTVRIFALATGFGFVVALSIELLVAVSPTWVLGKDTFAQRWSGHTLIITVVTPLLLVWRKLPRDWAVPARAAEAFLILCATFLVGQVVFLDWFHDSLGQIARGYWLYFFITLTAVRLGAHGTVIVVAIVALQGLVGAALGLGFFSNDLAKTNLSNYFFYTMTLAAVGLPLATYFTERKLASKALEEHRNTLEASVAARTTELAMRLEEMSVLNKKLEDVHIQLLQSEKMASLGQLAAGVAHEINNPIGFVHSNLGVLETHVAKLLEVIDAFDIASSHGFTPQDVEAIHHLKAEKEIDYLRGDIPALLAESKDGLMRVKEIVQNLKDFSRIGESGWEKADIHHCLDSTLKIIANELKYKCTLIKHYDPALPQVRCIAAQLNQVFLNLLVNAANAIQTSGEITITTQSLTPGTVQIRIADTGCGIPPEDLRRIFDPFFTTKPIGQGTGLGLSIVYGIVRKHFGSIEVESKVGQGSTFILNLPIDPPV
jgi:signal transduction histidine kinase